MTAKDIIKATLKRLKKEQQVDPVSAFKALNKAINQWNTPK